MRTLLGEKEYEVYGEPSPAMVADFHRQGLTVLEDWEGELAACHEPPSAAEAQIRMRTYEGWVGPVAVALSQQA